MGKCYKTAGSEKLMENYKDMNHANFKAPPESYWLASTAKTSYPAIEEDLKVDVAIVGGGMTGITSAYLLKREGLRVAVIEADRILQGTTGHTTAKITSQHGFIYNKLRNYMGEEKARRYAEANETAIRTISDLIKFALPTADIKISPRLVISPRSFVLSSAAPTLMSFSSKTRISGEPTKNPLPTTIIILFIKSL
jgi:NADPH-dependent 2,4-dienoyl-CoA reductase/sulfur reductase-like enzyme